MGEKVTVYFADEQLFDWLVDMIEKKRFRNISHGIEYALQHIREQHPDTGLAI